MIDGAHAVIYSTEPEADRAFLGRLLGGARVDAGDGWLIFALPPAELAVHPAAANDHHELYLTCADIARFVAEMERQGVACAPVEETGWGRLTRLTLPGGGRLGVYQPRHPRP